MKLEQALRERLLQVRPRNMPYKCMNEIYYTLLNDPDFVRGKTVLVAVKGFLLVAKEMSVRDLFGPLA